jgi:hypothetical protein
MGEKKKEAKVSQQVLRVGGQEGGLWPHPGQEVLLQLLHQEVSRLLLIGLVGLQVPPGFLGAGVTGVTGQWLVR